MKSFIFLFAVLFPIFSFAQSPGSDKTLNQVYGAVVTGCTQQTVEPTGHNRNGPHTAGRRYVVYGYNGADIAVGDPIKCVWGTVTVDVTSIAGSKVGVLIPSGQQRVFLVKESNTYISCISKTASRHYDICPLD